MLCISLGEDGGPWAQAGECWLPAEPLSPAGQCHWAPLGAQAAPLCEDTQVSALFGGLWVTLELVIREANIDLHTGFSFAFHTSALALTFSSLLLST